MNKVSWKKFKIPLAISFVVIFFALIFFATRGNNQRASGYDRFVGYVPPSPQIYFNFNLVDLPPKALWLEEQVVEDIEENIFANSDIGFQNNILGVINNSFSLYKNQEGRFVLLVEANNSNIFKEYFLQEKTKGLSIISLGQRFFGIASGNESDIFIPDIEHLDNFQVSDDGRKYFEEWSEDFFINLYLDSSTVSGFLGPLLKNDLVGTEIVQTNHFSRPIFIGVQGVDNHLYLRFRDLHSSFSVSNKKQKLLLSTIPKSAFLAIDKFNQGFLAGLGKNITDQSPFWQKLIVEYKKDLPAQAGGEKKLEKLFLNKEISIYFSFPNSEKKHKWLGV